MMKIFSLLFFLFSGFAHADVVKPALVEISIFNDKKVEISIDLSIEAVMTGIGTQYKNTTDAPNSDQYDELRALEAEALRERFKGFENDFLKQFRFLVNGEKKPLTLSNVFIDIIGYKQRPRKSTLTYTTQLKQWPKVLFWQYPEVYGDSALRWRIYEKDKYTWSDWSWLRDGKPSGNIVIDHPEPMSGMDRFNQFVSIGFDHVIPLGWDHILFIVGMALSSLLWKRLLLLVTTFTLAHTFTLGLATYGLVDVPARIVEPLIAFSIAYVAIENLIKQSSSRRQNIIVFIFGLIHGLGFASMLKTFEMPAQHFFVTLLGFNVGVEIAQIAIVLFVVSIVLGAKALKLNYHQLLVTPISIVIALIGVWWGIERIIA